MSSSHAPNSEAGSSSRTIGAQEFPNAARYRPVKTNAAAMSSRAASSGQLRVWSCCQIGSLSPLSYFLIWKQKWPVACVSRAANSHIA